MDETGWRIGQGHVMPEPPIPILYIIPHLGRGGAERQLVELVTRLDRTRFTPSVCHYSHQEDLVPKLEQAGVPIFRLLKGGRWSPLAFFQLLLLIRKLRPHLVHTWLVSANFWGRLAALLCGVPIIIASERTCDPDRFLPERWLERLLARWTSRLLVVCEASKQLVTRQWRVPAEKISVVTNGVDLADFTSVSSREASEWRQAIGVPDQCFLMATIGRMSAEKGHRQLWHALARIGPTERLWSMVVLGDGPLRPQLRQLAQHLGIDRRLIMVGKREQVAPFLAAADCLVLPSLREGMPNVVIEAMAASKAVIATTVGGVSELVTHGVNGLLVPPADPDALASAIRQLAARPDAVRAMGQAGRRRAEQHFTLQRMVEETVAVYEQALAGQAERRWPAAVTAFVPAATTVTDPTRTASPPSANRALRRELAYVISRFPTLVETFILRELEELRRTGWRLHPFSLRLPERGLHLQTQAGPWLERTGYFTASRLPDLLAANWYALMRRPWLYLSSLWQLARDSGPYHPLSLARQLAAFYLGVHLADTIRAQKLCHLHAHFGWVAATAAWAAARFADCGFSVTVHGSDLHDPWMTNDFLLAKLVEARFVVCVSEYHRRRVQELMSHSLHYRHAHPRLTVIHSGIEPALLSIPPPLASGQSEAIRLIAVGRLSPEKGHRHLIEAVHLLRERGHRARCTIVGAGPERVHLQRLISALGLSDQVRMVGALKLEQIGELCSRSDIFVQPSLREGLPLAVMEAMARGLPVVASNLAGLPELIADRQNGLLVPAGDAQALANALATLITSPALRLELSARARQTVAERFLISTNVLKLAALFEEALAYDHTVQETAAAIPARRRTAVARS